IDRQRAMQLAKEILRRDRHRLEAVGPCRRLAEFGMGAVIHAEHERPLRSVLDAFVDRPGVARPLVLVGPGGAADYERFAGSVWSRIERPLVDVERAAD